MIRVIGYKPFFKVIPTNIKEWLKGHSFYFYFIQLKTYRRTYYDACPIQKAAPIGAAYIFDYLESSVLSASIFFVLARIIM